MSEKAILGVLDNPCTLMDIIRKAWNLMKLFSLTMDEEILVYKKSSVKKNDEGREIEWDDKARISITHHYDKLRFTK